MKHKLLNTEHYFLVVSYEEIKDVRLFKGKWYLEKGKILNVFPNYLTDLSECKLVLAHLPLNNAPYLEGVDVLPEIKLPSYNLEANDMESYIREINNLDKCVGFIDGYNKSKETFKYTKEDMINAIQFGRGMELWKEEEQIEKYLKSIHTPIYFECDMEYQINNEVGNDGFEFNSSSTYPPPKPKTITTLDGRTQWVGNYLFK